MSMMLHPSLHHFKKGISNIKQWTGMEYKGMEHIFIGALAGSVYDADIVRAA